MTKILLGAFFCILLFQSCEDSIFPNPGGTYFSGSINGENHKGSGVVFLDEQDHSALIRIIAGNAEFYQSIHISLESLESGTYLLSKDQASVSEVHGLDVFKNIDYSAGNSGDFITFEHSEGFFEGEFLFGISENSTSSSHSIVTGRFRIEASFSTSWNCNFDNSSVTFCYFFE